MTRALTAEDLMAGAKALHTIAIPSNLLEQDSPGKNSTGKEPAGSVVLRPLTVRDIQRVNQASKEQTVLASILMVQQALAQPTMTVEQVSSLPAGLVEFLLNHVNKISGLSLDSEEVEQAVRAPLARACFLLAREFGWTPEQCSQLTVGQVLLYLEMLGQRQTVEADT